MKKLLVIGIDALDRLLLEEFSDHLPSLTRLRSEAVFREVRSTFPPDSDTAWATIATGHNPAQHGVVRFVDPLEKVDQIQNSAKDNEVLQGRTFWDIVAAAGHRSVAVFPHLGYPAWESKALMVTRGSTRVNGVLEPGVASNRPGVIERYPEPPLVLGVRGFPDRGDKGLREYAEKLRRLTVADAQFAMRLMQTEAWDLFFTYLPTLDATGHFFWRFHDPEDPGFDPKHPLRYVIRDMYALYDQLVGEFLELVDADTSVMILSDHGHGARPFRLVNVNEILRNGGYLKARDLSTRVHLKLWEKSKRAAVNLVSRFGLARLAGWALRHLPQVKESLTRPSSIDWNETVAYASDMSGIKAYTYGGVIINREALGGREYEDVRDEIITLLRTECVLPDGEELIEFICRREEAYRGPHLDKYPDILLEFTYGYGLGWDVRVPLITHAASHNLVPGSHRGATGTFLFRGAGDIAGPLVDLHDVAPTVLDFFGVDKPADLSGSSLLRA